MRTRAEMETELLAQLQVATNSSMFPSTRLTTLIQNAYTWATNLFVWLDLVQAKCTNSIASQEYYDYPSDFRSGTIMRLEIDGISYERKNYEDYLAYKENNPGDTFKMFANYGRFYFIHPTPSANGTNNITIWGAINAPALANGSDVTIFTDNKQDGNEAIVRKALAVALKRIDNNLSQTEEANAIATLTKLSADEQQSTQRDQRIQHPKFVVPDYYAPRTKTTYGNFNLEDLK